jgi:hypothetical protein
MSLWVDVIVFDAFLLLALGSTLTKYPDSSLHACHWVEPIRMRLYAIGPFPPGTLLLVKIGSGLVFFGVWGTCVYSRHPWAWGIS